MFAWHWQHPDWEVGNLYCTLSTRHLSYPNSNLHVDISNGFAEVSGNISVHIAHQRIQRLSGNISLNRDHFSGFLVSAILYLNMASGFLLTENHIPSIVTRKGWGGVFLWVSEKYCLRNGNTALIGIQTLFLLLFSVKYNKNIVVNIKSIICSGREYTIHRQGFQGREHQVPALSYLSVWDRLWLRDCRSTDLKTKYEVWNAKSQLSTWKTPKRARGTSLGAYSCCLGKALGNRKGWLWVWKRGIHKAYVRGNITTGHCGVQVSSNMLWIYSWLCIIATKQNLVVCKWTWRRSIAKVAIAAYTAIAQLLGGTSLFT